MGILVPGKVLHHICHRHPPTRAENPGAQVKCFVCAEFFENEEHVYGCILECEDEIFLHTRCGEFPRVVKALGHTLQQKVLRDDEDSGESRRSKCSICNEVTNAGLCYSDIGGVGFTAHLVCALVDESGCALVDVEDAVTSLLHPSHPQHELLLLRRPCSFRCDACGEFGEERYSSYLCTVCQYWIHEQCALLPPTSRRELHPQHALSLAFRLPEEYHKFRTYGPKDIKDDGATQLPWNDASEDLIRPLVMRRGVKTEIPEDKNGKYKFHSHHHELSLVSSERDDHIDYDYVDHGRRSSDIICDGCTTPIITRQNNQLSSSSSSSPPKYYYYECRQCSYFLHSACFNLPPKLPLHPLHRFAHTLVLKSSPNLKFNTTRCDVCRLYTNGLVYTCAVCKDFTVDIKCASLPLTIKHPAHPRHSLEIMRPSFHPVLCGVCGSKTDREFYGCYAGCVFGVHFQCILLPAANEHGGDKHALPLTYNAGPYHSGEFYCDVCEEEMDPKRWMYYCRECDQSIHPDCFPATSGRYRNMKFGQQFVIGACHDPRHPLTYQLIARKRCCDLCGEYRYGEPGFECGSCHFVMCWSPCGKDRGEDAIRAID